MKNQEANSPTSLSTMLGSGEEIVIKGKTYVVKPIALKHIQEFMKDDLSIGCQLFNAANIDSSKKIDKWMSGYCCYSESGAPMSLSNAMEDDWDIVDLKEFFRKLCDLSG